MTEAEPRGQTVSMDPVVRKLRPEEAPTFRESVMVPFLDPFAGDPDQVADSERWAATSELDRAWVVDAGGRFVGNGAIHSLNVTLPAAPGKPCPTVAMAGVSAISGTSSSALRSPASTASIAFRYTSVLPEPVTPCSKNV